MLFLSGLWYPAAEASGPLQRFMYFSQGGAAVKIYEKMGFVVTGRAERELKVDGKFHSMQFMELLLRP